MNYLIIMIISSRKTENFEISHIKTYDYEVKNNIVLLLDVSFWYRKNIDLDSFFKISNDGQTLNQVTDFLNYWNFVNIAFSGIWKKISFSEK